jgi:threonine/homoserine/homoserine lactone efflux protein
MVGAGGQLSRGAILLGFYSLGLAVPMLAVAYSSHLLQRRLRVVAQHETILRYVTGIVLVGFGLYSIVLGNVAFKTGRGHPERVTKVLTPVAVFRIIHR